ncbi:MAG: hypothetical protein HUK03_08205, partial [Bacteroidaceae bacterium]|nr:hypothetical protein [Bacteroidaceae bacterium]
MKRNFQLFVLAAIAWLAATSVQAQGPGLDMDEEGYYLLNSAADVEAYSAWVNLGGDALLSKAKLTADIDYTGITHDPIGKTESLKFNGVFDGQNHRVKNMV